MRALLTSFCGLCVFASLPVSVPSLAACLCSAFFLTAVICLSTRFLARVIFDVLFVFSRGGFWLFAWWAGDQSDRCGRYHGFCAVSFSFSFFMWGCLCFLLCFFLSLRGSGAGVSGRAFFFWGFLLSLRLFLWFSEGTACSLTVWVISGYSADRDSSGCLLAVSALLCCKSISSKLFIFFLYSIE